MVERRGRKKRIEKGSREGIEKDTKRQFKEKEGLRDSPLLEFLDPTMRCSHLTSWSSSIKICFYKLIESIIKKKCHGVIQNAKKNVPLVKQNVMKLEVFIL